MARTKAKQEFHAEILNGHKGAAVIVPFDPAKIWEVEPAALPNPWKSGFLVQGKMNQTAFEGWIGHRWRRNFILIDKALLRRMRASIGDVVLISVTPRDAPQTPVSRRAVKSG